MDFCNLKEVLHIGCPRVVASDTMVWTSMIFMKISYHRGAILQTRQTFRYHAAMTRESISLGQWTIDDLNELLLKAAMTGSAGERIAFLSDHFHGIPYLENTLVGGANTDEVFVVNLASVDCYTLIDYIEAMRLSSSFEDFVEFLKKIRYRGGIVSFGDRNHFFTDWREFNGEFVEDATGKIGLQDTRTVRKVLKPEKRQFFFLFKELDLSSET